MKVYCVMKYFSEEYHLGDVYSHEEDAQAEAMKDLMKLDYVEIRDVLDIPKQDKEKELEK